MYTIVQFRTKEGDYMSKKIERPVRLTNLINIMGMISIHYFEFDKNFCFEGEKHDYWEMVYVDSGNVLITADEKKHILGQGEIIFHKPNEFHTISADGKKPTNVCVICFETKSKAMEWFQDKKMLFPKEFRGYIKTIINEGKKTFALPINDPYAGVIKLLDKPAIGGLQIIKTSLEQLLIMLIRVGEGEQVRKKKLSEEDCGNCLVNKIVEILNDNIYGKINVYDICQNLSYSKTHVSKVFNENMGCSIIEYYTSLKITEAKKLIRERIYSFTEISNMLQFSNPHYFSKVFKKVVNMSPREYLQSVTI